MRYSLTTRALKKNTYSFEDACRKNNAPGKGTDYVCTEPQENSNEAKEVPEIDPEMSPLDVNNPEYETMILSSCNSSSSLPIHEELGETSEYILPEQELSRRQERKRFKNITIFEEEDENTDEIILRKLNEDGYYDEILPSDEDIKFEKPKKTVEIWKYAAVAALFLASVTTIAMNLVKIIK